MKSVSVACGEGRKGGLNSERLGRNRKINEGVTPAGRAGMILLKAYGDC